MQSFVNDENEGQQMNPWISVWLHPRKTVQYVVENKTGKFVFFIAWISGIIFSLDMVVNNDLVEAWTPNLLFSLIAGPIIGVVGFYFIAAIYHIFSKMLGGQGTSEQTRMAFAISEIILFVVGILLLLDLLIVGRAKLGGGYELSVGQSAWLEISPIINSIVGIWSLVVLVAAISEVHRFSIWKAVFVSFLPTIILILISIFFFGLPFSF